MSECRSKSVQTQQFDPKSAIRAKEDKEFKIFGLSPLAFVTTFAFLLIGMVYVYDKLRVRPIWEAIEQIQKDLTKILEPIPEEPNHELVITDIQLYPQNANWINSQRHPDNQKNQDQVQNSKLKKSGPAYEAIDFQFPTEFEINSAWKNKEALANLQLDTISTTSIMDGRWNFKLKNQQARNSIYANDEEEIFSLSPSDQKRVTKVILFADRFFLIGITFQTENGQTIKSLGEVDPTNSYTMQKIPLASNQQIYGVKAKENLQEKRFVEFQFILATFTQ